LKSLLLY